MPGTQTKIRRTQRAKVFVPFFQRVGGVLRLRGLLESVERAPGRRVQNLFLVRFTNPGSIQRNG